MNIQEEIARRNELFAGKTPAEKRVLVAQDVLKLLTSKQIRPNKGDYLLFNVRNDTYDADKSLQEILAGGEKCECCAKGALMVSCILFNNNYRWDERGDAAYLHPMTITRTFANKNGLLDIFPVAMLNKIEAWFEGWDQAADSHKQADRILEWSVENNDTERIQLIMQNIIDNNGDFCPEQFDVSDA